MSHEIEVIEATNTWTIQALTQGKKTIVCKWLFKKIFNVDGSLDKHKARLVEKGYTQQPSLDFIDKFSQVEKLTCVNVILSLVTTQNWKPAKLDINNFLWNEDLFEEIYMDLPLGYPIKEDNMVCKHNKSLYGLRQSSRQWYHKFPITVIKYGFT